MMNVGRHGFPLLLLITSPALAADPVYTVDQCQGFVDYVRKEVRSTDCASLTQESRALKLDPTAPRADAEAFMGVYSIFCGGKNLEVKEVQRLESNSSGLIGATSVSRKTLSVEEVIPLRQPRFVDSRLREKINAIYESLAQKSDGLFAIKNKQKPEARDREYRAALKNGRAKFWDTLTREMLGGGCLESHPKIRESLCAGPEPLIGDCSAKLASMKTSEILQVISKVASVGEKSKTTAFHADEKGFKGNRSPAIAPVGGPAESNNVNEIRE